MRKTMFALAAAVALGAATISTGVIAAPGHGGHGGGYARGGGGWHGGGWGPGAAVGLGLGLGGLYAYGGAPYGYCGGYPSYYGYYNNCAPAYGPSYYGGW